MTTPKQIMIFEIQKKVIWPARFTD